MKFTESTLKRYAAPLSDTENQQCLNAIKMIRDALKGLGFSDENREIIPLYSDTYAYSLEMRRTKDWRKIKMFIQGSYANNTNVRTQSDVDIAVIQEETFQPEYRIGQSGLDYGFSSSAVASKSFKDEVQECLTIKFGRDVKRGDKSIKVHGNTYRKDADTVPCMRYRDYRGDYRKDESNYVGGVVIFPDSGGRIINYPEQHIANGRQKNVATNHYYKKMVRIIKNMKLLMSNYGFPYANDVSSFGLESLLWNIPDEIFKKWGLYGFAFEEVLNYLQAHKADFLTYKEANGIKSLCPTQTSAKTYENFIDILVEFFEYDINGA